MHKLKFIIDECVGNVVCKWLIKNGFDAINIACNFSGATDEFILEKAFFENRVIITLDKDFGELLFRQQLNHYGIIFLRLKNEAPTNIISVLESLLNNYLNQIEGNYVVLTDNAVKIIKLK